MDIPLLSLLVLVAIGMALAVSVATVPGALAARIRPADVLRAE